MGLTTFKNAPEGITLKIAARISKNYIEKKEIKQLEAPVSSYIDFIKNLIERQNTFTIQALTESVNKFLSFNEYKVVEGKRKTLLLIKKQSIR